MKLKNEGSQQREIHDRSQKSSQQSIDTNKGDTKVDNELESYDKSREAMDEHRDLASKVKVGDQEVYLIDENAMVKKMEGMIDLLDVVL